jgi:hypothetical protein
MKIRKKILFAVIVLTAVMIMAAVCSCEKKEPEAQPDPGKIMQSISEQFPEFKSENIKYESGTETKKLSDAKAVELYSDDKNKPVDLSKIEKYCVAPEAGKDKDTDTEIGIFKLYDRTNSGYVKRMAQTRISKMQKNNADEIKNNAEARSYGNYVYYVSHPQKDKIFEIIEDSLRARGI